MHERDPSRQYKFGLFRLHVETNMVRSLQIIITGGHCPIDFSSPRPPRSILQFDKKFN